MKMARKIMSTVLVCAMSLSLLTACGGMTQKQLEAYIKEKGYITREEAQAITSQNSGTTIIQQTTESQDLVAAVNAALKEKGSDITVKSSSELKSDAQELADAYGSENYDSNAISEIENAIRNDDKIIIVSSSEATTVSADEIATIILRYQKNGIIITAIGCSTAVGTYRGNYTTNGMEIEGSLFFVVASYETTVE